MPKTASQSVEKWARNASQAADDYVEGARTTTRDQVARAVASKAIWQAALTASFPRDSYARGLTRVGRAGWLAAVTEKGSQNYGTGVGSTVARNRYTTNSARYDTARNAAATIVRGPKGSAVNLTRVAAVANALRAVKVAA